VAIQVISDMRAQFGLVRGQGDRPTCTAFAISDAHRAARGDTEHLSAEHLYFHSINLCVSKDPTHGVPLSTALDALRQQGQCHESGWPYLKMLPVDMRLWYPPATANPNFTRRSLLNHPGDVNKLIIEVEGNQPMIVTLLLGERFYSPVSGVVDVGPNDADTGYHAVVAVGAARINGTRALLVRNSWGASWGDSGHCWITEPYLSNRLYQTARLQ